MNPIFGLILLSAAVAQNPQQFCSNVAPGQYCNSDQSGYYDCWLPPNHDTSFTNCPLGMECLCFQGSRCPNAEISPCGVPPVLPVYPKQWVANSTTEGVVCGPFNCFDTFITETTYFDYINSRMRVDQEIRTIYTNHNLTEAKTILSYGSANNVEIYTINWEFLECNVQNTNSTFQLEGVPGQYLALNSSGDTSWWWFQHEGNPSVGGTTVWIETENLTSNYIVRPVKIVNKSYTGNQGKTYSTYTTIYTSFVQDVSDDGLFVLPSLCA